MPVLRQVDGVAALPDALELRPDLGGVDGVESLNLGRSRLRLSFTCTSDMWASTASPVAVA
jgi:hypothetical protein